MYEFEVIEINPGSTVLHDKNIDMLIADLKPTAYNKGIVYIDLTSVIDFEVNQKYVVLKKDKMMLQKSSIINIQKVVK